MFEIGKYASGFDHGGAAGEEARDFSANISPFGMPQPVREALKDLVDGVCPDAVMADLSSYPDPFSSTLRHEIAKAEGLSIPPAERMQRAAGVDECVYCGNGASDVIYRFFLAKRPKHALIVEPTFSEYESALTLSGGMADHVLLTPETGFCVDGQVLEAVRSETDLLVLCSPNNPTGKSIPVETLEYILDACRKSGLPVLWDASFLDFAEEADRYGELIRSFWEKNLKFYVVKSFTKAYAMAGLRLGYLLSNDVDLIRKMRKAGPPWPVSKPAQVAGVVALQCKEYRSELRRYIAGEKEYLYGAFEELGFRPAPDEGERLYVPSDANFILLRAPRNDLRDFFRDRYRATLRECGNFRGLDEYWYRTAVRSREQNELFVDILKEAMNDG